MDDIKRPVKQQPVSTQTPAPQATTPDKPMPDSPEAAIGETPKEQKQHVVMNHKVSRRKVGPIIAIVLAVIITIGLIGVAVYVYLQSRHSKSDTPKALETAQTTENTTTTERLEVGDIDTATDNIDKQLNTLDDSKDFGSNDLSDSTLGL